MRIIIQSLAGRLPMVYSRLARSPLHRNFATETNEAAKVQSTTKPVIQLSDSCLQKLAEMTDSKAGKHLRISVDGGGCSGFQYKFELDDKVNEDDVLFGTDKSKIVIDTVSLEYCDGSTIDYHAELIRSGFRVIGNPKAEQGCSCGASFALKLD